LKLTGNSDTIYNKETEQYEFKLYFTNPSPINDNIMFTFSQGVDADGNEENIVFCEINPIEKRLLISLKKRKLEDVEITANCVYEVIKDPDSPLVFDNPEIRGIGVDDLEIEGDFVVNYPKSKATKSTIPITLQKTIIPTTLIKTTILITNPKTTIPIANPKSTILITNPKTTNLITNPKTTIPIANPKTTIPILNPKTSTPIIIPNKTTNVKNITPSSNSQIILKLTDQTDVTYNSETGLYEFKLYFTSPNSIDDNIMFSFSQGIDSDGNEENVVFCEINPIERRLLRSLNIRKLDEQITANCVYEIIKDPDKQLIFDNPEIRGVGFDDLEIEGDFKVYYKKTISSTSIKISTINSIESTIQNSKILSSTPQTITVTTSNIKLTTINQEQKDRTTIPGINRITTILKHKQTSLINPSIFISIKNVVKSEEIIQTTSTTTTPSNNTNNSHLNSITELTKFNSAGLSAGQICAIAIPCIALLLGAMIASLLLKGGVSAAAVPAMTNNIVPNFTEASSLSKVNLPHETITQSIPPNPVQPQITNINNPVVNRVFEPVTVQNAQIVQVQEVQTIPVQQVQMIPVQEVQAVPVQEITQIQVPMTHTRGVSSSIGFAGSPQ
jgi:hypothetical protein